LSKQMQQFMEQLQSTMTGLAGSSGEGASEEQ
jgi:hypothetical protein